MRMAEGMEEEEDEEEKEDVELALLTEAEVVSFPDPLAFESGSVLRTP